MEQVAAIKAKESLGAERMSEMDENRTSNGRFANGHKLRAGAGVRPFVIGRMPKGCSGILRSLGRFRQALEAALGEVDEKRALWVASQVSAAVAHERNRRLADWLTATKGDSMSPETFQTLLAQSGRAVVERDKAMRELGLNAKASANPFDELYANFPGEELSDK